MKPGRITGALGGLFGMVGAIVTAATPTPQDRIIAKRNKAKALRRRAERALANGKRDKHRKLTDKAESIEDTLRAEGVLVDPADGLP